MATKEDLMAPLVLNITQQKCVSSDSTSLLFSLFLISRHPSPSTIALAAMSTLIAKDNVRTSRKFGGRVSATSNKPSLEMSPIPPGRAGHKQADMCVSICEKGPNAWLGSSTYNS